VPTVNENAFNTPLPVKTHVPAAVMRPGSGLESMVVGQGGPKVPASPDAKPLPETVTTVPIGPEVGTSVILGAGVLVTVNVA